MSDIFDNFDIEKFISSEDSIVESDNKNFSVEAPPKEVTNTNTTTVDTKPVEDPTVGMLNISLADLEGDAPIIGETKEENEDGDGKKASPQTTAPAVKNKETSSSENTPLSSLTSVLKEAGAFNALEEEEIKEIKDAETLVDLMLKNMKANEKAGLNDTQKEYLAALENGIPHEVFAQRKASADIYANITDEQLENEQNQTVRMQLIQRKNIAAGLSEKDALKIAQLSAKAGEDVEDAKEARNYLVEYEKKALQKQVEEARIARDVKAKEDSDKIAALKSKINEKSSIVEGINFNTVTKDKIFKSITGISKTVNNQPMNEFLASYMENDDFKIKAHYIYDLTKGFTDFSKIKQSEKTTAIKELKDTLDKTTSTGTTGAPSKVVTQGKTTNDLLTALQLTDFKSRK